MKLSPTAPSATLTAQLLHAHPSLETSLAGLWLPSPHQLNGNASIGLSLRSLEAALDSVALALVLPADFARAARKRQLSFIGGRLCAERALEAAGRPALAIARGEGGAPQWPAGWHGSITHTDGLAYALVVPAAAYRGVGIDSEWQVEAEALASVRELCCTEHERRAWLGGADEALIATLLFSAKEAGFKAIYGEAGCFVDFTEFEVRELDLRAGRLLLSPVPGSAFHGRIAPISCRFQAQAGARACVHAQAWLPVNA